MDWFQRWGISLLVVLLPIVLGMAYQVPKWKSQYDRFKHIRHESRPFGCESFGKVSSSSDLKLAYEKGANTTSFVKVNGAAETHAYQCDRPPLNKLFAVIKPAPEFTMPQPFRPPPRRVTRPTGSTWVAMLGEKATYRDGQRSLTCAHGR